MDLYPTCLAATGAPPLPHQHPDGRNLRPLLEKNSPLERTALFWHFPHYNNHPHTFPGSVIRRGDWKFIQSFDPGKEELYHLGDDPSEATDLMSAHPEKAAELRAVLRRLARHRRRRNDAPQSRLPPIDS